MSNLAEVIGNGRAPKIKSANYLYNPDGSVKECFVSYLDGTTRKFVQPSPQELREIQTQLATQQRQVLMEKN